MIEQQKAPTIVLFDMDGTTVRHLNPRILQILEWLDDLAHKITSFCSKIFKRKIQSPQLVGFRKGKRKKLFVHRALHKIRRKEVGQIVEPCPGIYDVLELLKENNVRMGIISNGLGKGYGHDILDTFQLKHYYEVTIFREDIPRTKPHPDPILKAIEELKPKLTKDDIIWYFGDRQKDIISALASKSHLPCPLEPFAYNLNAAIAILQNNIAPDHIIMGWPDLETKLHRIFEKKNTNNIAKQNQQAAE